MTDERLHQAIEAAEQVWHDKPPCIEPANTQEAQAAVQRLSKCFEELPASQKKANDAARGSGTLLSDDPLQGLAEIVQNADDANATQVRFLLRPTELFARHDGTPVCLQDVLALTTPWLSTKAEQADSIGRFGVGLSTLRSLSPTLEVHSTPYHVTIGDPPVTWVEPGDLPSWLREDRWTTLRIPLQDKALQSSELEEWFNRWDDSALLFLRSVARVTLLDLDGDPIRELAVSRRQGESLEPNGKSTAGPPAFADSADGRSWAAYSTDLPTPEGVSRGLKRTGPTTPIAVAVPLDLTETGQVEADQIDSVHTDAANADTGQIEESSTDAGQIYVGLPVVPIRARVFVNAQFDPLTNRKGFADTPWNRALVDPVAEWWSEAVLDLFGRNPQAAWQAIPLPHTHHEQASSPGLPVIDALETALLGQARRVVASRLSFRLPEQGLINLSQLAVEAEPLQGVLREAEVAKLAGLSATLPIDVRDPAGRWRLVLDDWRSNGTGLPEEVSVEQALELVGYERRTVESTIRLVAAALQEELHHKLLALPCITAQDGRRLIPPVRDSTEAVTKAPTPLAEQLGIATLLHPAHLADANGAPDVLAWLEECGALLDSSDDAEVVRRLAKAGESGECLDSPLTDEQLGALRDAFEQFDQAEREALGQGVGKAVLLQSYTYDTQGRSQQSRGKKTNAARPVDAYLPRAIDTGSESFAVAASESPGLEWLSDHYATALRSQAGREGIGALRFLRLLGAETAPRLRPHPQLTQRYRNRMRGLEKSVGPQARSDAMAERAARYTLGDRDSPDLSAVVTDISLEPHRSQRLQRARALLAALGRAWDRRLSEYADVDSATADYGWSLKGRIPAFWLAQAGDVAWLDDESGTPRRPAELRVRTPGTEAVYGPSSPDYLHAELDQPIRRVLLAALGVSSDPSRSQLVERLRELKKASDEDDTSPDDLQRDTALVYRAIARGLDSDDSGLTTGQLRHEFGRYRLVLTDLGWLSPQNVLVGPPIFGDLRAFAPAVTECEPLWDALHLRRPSATDCLNVLRKIAYRRKTAPDPSEEAILLVVRRRIDRGYTKGLQPWVCTFRAPSPF